MVPRGSAPNERCRLLRSEQGLARAAATLPAGNGRSPTTTLQGCSTNSTSRHGERLEFRHGLGLGGAILVFIRPSCSRITRERTGVPSGTGSTSVCRASCPCRHQSGGCLFSQIDWRQSHVLLNAAFSVSVSSPLATCGIQWGQINRPTTRDNRMDASRFEVCAQRWMAIHDGNCTVALPDDCKFGHDAVGNVLRPTLLKSSTGPDDAMSVRLRGGGRNSTARFNPKWHWTLEMSGDKHSGCWMPVGICMGGRARRDGTRHSTPDFELALLIPK